MHDPNLLLHQEEKEKEKQKTKMLKSSSKKREKIVNLNSMLSRVNLHGRLQFLFPHPTS